MLTTNLKLAEKYNYLDPKSKRRRVFAHGRFAGPAAGQHAIDGDEVFANAAGVHDAARCGRAVREPREIF